MKFSHAAGHARTTRGKQSPDGVKEWEQTVPIMLMVMDELAKYEGVEQRRFDDPTGQRDIPLKERYNAINAWGADVHIDYHLNAYGTGWNDASGVEMWIADSKPKEALALAQKMQNNLVAVTGFKNRGVKFENWDMVYFTKMTAVLAELGFMTHRQNTEFIRSAVGQRKIALAIVAALVYQYGLKKKYVAPPQQNQQSQPTKVIRYIYTGGYGGPSLLDVHDYLMKIGDSFDVKRGADGSIIFLIGPFDTGMQNFKNTKGFLDSKGHYNKLLTREEAAEWR
ncbi:N-acetylmuramoyl-L-alanine amidase family protein [Bacillus sp. T33-2]|uniref:N-acetylmuramoyl-L-alanine amidase family protein n=1 Tax=Bacillus sp. T33-2 TaxID=2054168 RepID=UPI000C76B25E|nr:N-acetylmuramoyl-L-alanine amidase [Bacillus sp. T33-2]PLR93181.1 N-acetylmuramoyl-L-alanine amidase [Bacillus sp. T33-2]